jgi:two-component system, OmpR family, response regulator
MMINTSPVNECDLMRVLIVEDDDLLVDGLTRALEQAGYALDRVRNGEKADFVLRQQEFNLLVLDVGLPGIDGFEVLRRLRRRGCNAPVLVLTARDAVEDRVHGLDLGADDYLAKPFVLSEFEARVRALLRRGQYRAQSQLSCGGLRLDATSHQAWINDLPLELTSREWAILEYLLLRAGQLLSKDKIVEAICNWDEAITPNAVEVYVSRLRSKLEPARVRIRTIRGFGYLLEESPNGAG